MRLAGSVTVSVGSHSPDTAWSPHHRQQSCRSSSCCRRSSSRPCRTDTQIKHLIISQSPHMKHMTDHWNRHGRCAEHKYGHQGRHLLGENDEVLTADTNSTLSIRVVKCSNDVTEVKGRSQVNVTKRDFSEPRTRER